MSDGNLQRESSESQWSSTDMQPSGSVSATLNHSHIDRSSIQAATAQQFLSHSTPSASSNHNQQTPPNPLGTTSSTQQETNVPFAWYNPTHAPPSAPRHDPATFLTIDHSQSLFDWSSMFSNQPSTLLTSSTECGALALESIMPWTGGSNEDVTATASGSGGGSGSRFGLGGGGAVQVGGGLWNDGVFGVQNQLGPSGPSQDGVGQVLGGVSPNTVDKHMRDGVSLSDLCKFFLSLSMF